MKLDKIDSAETISGPPTGPPVGPTTAGREAADRLEYIADMVQELRCMAESADCDTLARILEVAHREATRRRRM
ncbi:MAG: hypothetical protein AB7K67_14775 [Hyphomicrobiaceae bacterium]|jgi:hypothetical protein